MSTTIKNHHPVTVRQVKQRQAAQATNQAAAPAAAPAAVLQAAAQPPTRINSAKR